MARKKGVFDPEALKLVRVDIAAVHAAVRLGAPPPGGTLRFPAEKLTALYGQMSSYGFETFSFMPNGARMGTAGVREAVVTLEQTALSEELGVSGQALRPFAELAVTLLETVQSTLDVQGFQALKLRLIAFWPVPDGNATGFVSRAARISPRVVATLGPGVEVAGIRFNKVVVSNGSRDEWDVRIEPLLRQRNQLWIEVEPKYERQFAGGEEVGRLLEEAERYLRNEVTNAVLAMAGNKKGG